MIDTNIVNRISGLEKLGDKCDYVFHDSELISINFLQKEDRFTIFLIIKHWKYFGDDYKDVQITFKMNDVRSYVMDNHCDNYALEIYFEEYDGVSQGYYNDCMKVSSDLGFSIVCKNVEITSVEII